MKQFCLAVEVLIMDDKELFILRHVQSGLVTKVFNSSSDLSNFIDVTINQLKEQNENGK